MRFVLNGWPRTCPEGDLQPFINKRNELELEKDILMWGYTIIFSFSLQKLILNELHSSHMGVVKMKSIARSYVWWPRINSDIESVANICENCQVIKPSPPLAELKVWPMPNKVWNRINVDYIGPFQNKYFFVIIDAYSKWLEVYPTNSITTENTINILRSVSFRFTRNYCV